MVLPDRVSVERLVALILAVLCLVYLLLGWRIPVNDVGVDSPFSARSLPVAIGSIGLGLAILLLLRPIGAKPIGVSGFAWSRALGLIGLMITYALLIPQLGFVVTSAFFLASGFRVLGERRPVVLACVALGVSIGLWIIFWNLDVKLDWGVLGRLFV